MSVLSGNLDFVNAALLAACPLAVAAWFAARGSPRPGAWRCAAVAIGVTAASLAQVHAQQIKQAAVEARVIAAAALITPPSPAPSPTDRRKRSNTGSRWSVASGGGVIRFVRIEYNGEGWDDGMDESSRADMNFLDYVRKVSGFKIGEHPESNRISQLKRYPTGFAPPFVYMTGGDKNPASAPINVPPADVKGLRDYLLNEGMLFADCGSAAWDRSFRSFISAVFPDKQLLTIADDDPIFQNPFPFPNGAPPLWHHGGFKAMGIKHQGRWVVFYFPGDLNDAWKTGHSGLRQDLAEDCYKLGVNVIGYAYEHHLEITRRIQLLQTHQGNTRRSPPDEKSP